MKNFKKSLIVSNADIISNINFKEMIKSHIKNKSLMKIIFNNKKVLIIGGSDSMFNNWTKYMYDKHNYLNILRQLGNLSKTTQREMALNLGYSLGKLNYCLKELKKKGLIKISNFRKNTNRQKYIYVLTPKGISYRTKLTINYMKQKMKEYDELKKELNKKN